MAGMIWRNHDLNDLTTNLRLRIQGFEDAVEDMMREVVAEGAKDQAMVLEDAHTDTGRRRAETGGQSSEYGSISEGRIDSGLMINQINSHVERDGNVIRGRWGWQDPEKYFLTQDYGDARITAAHSLVESFIRTREVLIIRLLKLVRSHR